MLKLLLHFLLLLYMLLNDTTANRNDENITPLSALHKLQDLLRSRSRREKEEVELISEEDFPPPLVLPTYTPHVEYTAGVPKSEIIPLPPDHIYTKLKRLLDYQNKKKFIKRSRYDAESDEESIETLGYPFRDAEYDIMLLRLFTKLKWL